MLVKHYSLFYILYFLTFYANRIDTADNGEKEEIPVHSNLSRSCLKFRTWRQSLGAFVIYAVSLEFTWVKGRREGRGNEAGKLVRSHSCRLYLTIVCSTRRLIHSKLDDDTEREKPKGFSNTTDIVVAENILSVYRPVEKRESWIKQNVIKWISLPFLLTLVFLFPEFRIDFYNNFHSTNAN